VDDHELNTDACAVSSRGLTRRHDLCNGPVQPTPMEGTDSGESMNAHDLCATTPGQLPTTKAREGRNTRVKRNVP
jgi:hypothetical protein